MLFGSFGVFSENQYFEHLLLHLGIELGPDSFAFSSFHFLFYSGAFEEQEFLSGSQSVFCCCIVGEDPLTLGLHVSLRPFMSLFAFFFLFFCYSDSNLFDVFLDFFPFCFVSSPIASELCDFFHVFI